MHITEAEQCYGHIRGEKTHTVGRKGIGGNLTMSLYKHIILKTKKPIRKFLTCSILQIHFFKY